MVDSNDKFNDETEEMDNDEEMDMEQSFESMFESSMQELNVGDVVLGTVVQVTDDHVVVDVGYKSEGVIPLNEFKDEEGKIDINVGDEVDVLFERRENDSGLIGLSKEKADRQKIWGSLEEGAVVEGRIVGRIKGGLTVDIGINAFLPGSQVDLRPVRNLEKLLGATFDFKIIKLNKRRGNIVLSRRVLLEEQRESMRSDTLETLAEGQEVEGIVKNLTDYGAFVDLGGIDGLLHITDMAWKRVRHPSEIVEVGDEIDVVVLKYDKEKTRVSLGLKQLGEDPWAEIARRYPEGSRLFGKVSNITDYGCFVEIEDGVEGLVHVSEMDWTNKNVSPGNVVTLGDDVEVAILDIDPERRRISLGMKQCKANPWDEFSATHNKGDKVSGVIKSITDFGVFVGLNGDIDGLVHMSDVSWDIEGVEAIRDYKKGDTLDAVVLSIDPERERISLGIKQMEQDPVSTYMAEYKKGTIVKGTVLSVDAKAAVIDLGDGVEGTLRASELSRDRVEDASTVLKVGDEVEAKLMGVDRKSRALNLSVKAKDYEDESEAMKDYSKSQETTATTLGDLLKEQMDASKK